MSKKNDTTLYKTSKEVREKIDDLFDKYEELDKEYISYKEADMNREAGQVHKRMDKVYEEINQLRVKENMLKIKEQEEKENNNTYLQKIKLYEKFIKDKGLINDFDNFEFTSEDEESEER